MGNTKNPKQEATKGMSGILCKRTQTPDPGTKHSLLFRRAIFWIISVGLMVPSAVHMGEAVSFLEAQALPSRCMAVAVRFRKESSSMEAPMNPDGRGSSKYSQLSKKLQGRYYQPWSNSIPGNTDCRLCPMPRMRFKTGKGKRCLRNTMLLLTLARFCGTDLRPFAVRNMQELQARQLNALYDELYSTPAPKSLYWLVMIPDA